MAVAEDSEDEAAPRLGMDRAVEKGTARQILGGGFAVRAVFSAILEDHRQGVMPGGVLRRVADRRGGFGCLERNRRPMRERRAFVGADLGVHLPQKVLRRERDAPTGQIPPAGRTRPGRDGAVAARQAGEAEPGGVLAADQGVVPAVLAETQQDGRIGNAGAVVGNGDGVRRLAGPGGGTGYRNAHPRGVGAA